MFPLPADEPARLAALHALAILDTPPEALYDDVVALAAAVCRSPIALVNFVDADRQWGKALVGLTSSEAPREASFCARTICAQDGLLVIPDTLADPLWSQNAQVLGEPYLRFYAGVAIVSDDGHALGSVCVADRAPRQALPSEIDALRRLARQAAAHLELRRRQQELIDLNHELQRLSVVDALTGLPNRTLLFDRLDLALRGRERSGRDVGVLFCDLDGFKEVNDRLGHAAGDAMLMAVAERLLGATRASDTVARLGGDEFVVVCPQLTGDLDLEACARRLRDAAQRPVVLEVGVVVPQLSIGLAAAVDGDSAETLLARADEAMYDVKRTAPTARGTLHDAV